MSEKEAQDIKETLINKYGVGEYILFIVGLSFLARVMYNVVTLDFEKLTIETIGILLLFLSLGSLLVAKPMTILDFARKRLGMETKKNS